MNLRIIGALVLKDASLFFRNRFFALVTVLGLAAYVAIYFVMPRSVDESLKIGLYAPVIPPVFEQIQAEGLEVQVVESEEALKKAVIEGQYVFGVALPSDTRQGSAPGLKPRISVYFTSDTPDEMKQAMVVLIRELAYMQAGQPLPVEVSEEILGPDMMGMQIPPRNRLRPLFAVVIILTETFGLAALISEEIERRTIQALLVTPMTIKDLFAAKGVTGVTLAFGQAVLFMLIVGGMGVQPWVVLATLLLGAILVTGVGFIMAALSKDFMSVLSWGIVAFIILLIPSTMVVFPGLISGWVMAIPSYYLFDTVHKASNFGIGWSDLWRNLLVLLGFNIAIVWIGIVALRRRTL